MTLVGKVRQHNAQGISQDIILDDGTGRMKINFVVDDYGVRALSSVIINQFLVVARSQKLQALVTPRSDMLLNSSCFSCSRRHTR